MIKKLRGLMILNLTKEQQIISDFLGMMYLHSDSKELDEWLIYLARENGDEQLVEVMSNAN